MTFRIGLVFALPLVFSASAASAAPDRAALKQRCGGDYAPYCGDFAPDGPEMQASFRKNMASPRPATGPKSVIGARAEGTAEGGAGRDDELGPSAENRPVLHALRQECLGRALREMYEPIVTEPLDPRLGQLLGDITQVRVASPCK